MSTRPTLAVVGATGAVGTVMLDLSFVEQPLVHMAAACRIKELLLEQRVHHQLGADLRRQLRFLVGIRGLFKGAEQLLDLSVIRLQHFRRVGARSWTRTILGIFWVSRVTLWIGTVRRTFAGLFGCMLRCL